MVWQSKFFLKATLFDVKISPYNTAPVVLFQWFYISNKRHSRPWLALRVVEQETAATGGGCNCEI